MIYFYMLIEGYDCKIAIDDYEADSIVNGDEDTGDFYYYPLDGYVELDCDDEIEGNEKSKIENMFHTIFNEDSPYYEEAMAISQYAIKEEVAR